jgi:tetratricopeptide (TPR) repeat protein
MGYNDDDRRQDDRREQYRQEDLRRDETLESYRRQDDLDQDNRDWDNKQEDRDYREKDEAARRERFVGAVGKGDTSGTLHAIGGPDLVLDYLQFLPDAESPAQQSAADLVEQAIAADKRGDYQEALNDLDRSLQISPDQPFAYFLRGQCRHQLDRYAEAIRDFDRVWVANS